MKSRTHLKKAMIILPLCFTMLLCGCTTGRNLERLDAPYLFEIEDWPQPEGIERQKGVAIYITKGEAAYQSCRVNNEALEDILKESGFLK